jgi:hypothetical protein
MIGRDTDNINYLLHVHKQNVFQCLSSRLTKIKSGESVDFNQFSARVTSGGTGSNFLVDLKSLI